MSLHAASIASWRDIWFCGGWSKTVHLQAHKKLLNGVDETGVRGKEDGHHSRMGARLWLLWERWNTTLLHVITYIDKWSPTCSLAPVFGADLLKSSVYAGVNFPHNISPTMSSFTVYHMVMNLNTWVCFNSQHEQLFTLTLAYKLGLEHDVICSDIQCESICTFVLTLCILCQSKNKCVSCLTYTDGCCANCVKSLGKLLKVLK